MVLIKDFGDYHVGAYNGVYLQIVRSNVDVPKSETELELDRLQEEKQKKIEALAESELAEKEKSDKLIFLEAQQKKRATYFKGFKKEFGIPNETTMEEVFTQMDNSEIAFDDYIIGLENAAMAEANKYLDVDEGA